jgi:UDP-GlcNAc:undecaprenyl-phosphate GlcNAc-1-phosphate transferase
MVDTHWFSLITICLVTYLSTFCLVPFFSFLAHKIGLLDIPDGRIKVHAKPTPYLGGLAIYCGFLIGLVLFFSYTHPLFIVSISTSPFLFLGLLDDTVPLRPYKKFLGQAIIAIFLLCISTCQISFAYPYIFVPVCIVWILTIVNGFNLIDVMDGLATSVALGATFSFLSIALLCGDKIMSMLLAAFGGSLLAFLWYNRPSARIYLGDAGSLWIGSFLAIVSLSFPWSLHGIYGYITPLIVLSLPLIEVLSLIIIRTYKGLPFYLGSPHHFCHYLQSNGWSKQQILLYVAFISIILNGFACLHTQDLVSLPMLMSASCMFLIAWVTILRMPYL